MDSERVGYRNQAVRTIDQGAAFPSHTRYGNRVFDPGGDCENGKVLPKVGGNMKTFIQTSRRTELIKQQLLLGAVTEAETVTRRLPWSESL